MHLILISTVTFGLPTLLRGGGLHNRTACETAQILGLAGFRVRLESLDQLPDRRLNFLDLPAKRDNCFAFQGRNVRPPHFGNSMIYGYFENKLFSSKKIPSSVEVNCDMRN